MITNTGKQKIAHLLTGSSTNYPVYCAIGTGSTSIALTDYKLNTEAIRMPIDTFTSTTINKATYTTEFLPVALSGLVVKELGLFHNSGLGVGSCWDREGFAALTFNGTQFLRTRVTYRIY